MRTRIGGLAAGLLLTALVGPSAARAQEAETCTRFDWPLAREQAWFASPDLPVLASGAVLSAERPAGELRLAPPAEAGLPQPPSRQPKPDTLAGFVRLAAPAAPGVVQVTLSGEGWIDVGEEGGAPGRPVAHTGQHGCPTLRKSVRYSVGARPLIVTVSNARAETVRIAVAPAP